MPRKRKDKTTSHAEQIGQNIARLRKERGITQVQLAALTGLSQSNVSDYERGRMRPHCDLLIELARIFKVSADQILGLQAPPRHAAIRDQRFLRHLLEIDRLSIRNRDALHRTVKAFLTQVQ